MKCNQSRPGFELVSPCPYPATITITPRAPFKSVDAVQNRDDCVRDAFITSLRSNIIRQRLLENKTLHLNIANDQARALHAAQKNSEAYTYTQTLIVGAISQENTSISVQSTDTINACCTASANTKYTCFFCGDLVIIEVCVQPEMLLFSSVKKKAVSQNVSFEPKNNICCNMLSETRDNIDIKYYICFLRIPKTGCIIGVSRGK